MPTTKKYAQALLLAQLLAQLLAAPPSQAQNFRFEQFSASNGLSNNAVYSIAQYRRGLTDMARCTEGEPGEHIRNWLRNGPAVESIGTWEKVFQFGGIHQTEIGACAKIAAVVKSPRHRILFTG